MTHATPEGPPKELLQAAYLCAKLARTRLAQCVATLGTGGLEHYAQQVALSIASLYAIECHESERIAADLDESVTHLRGLLGELADDPRADSSIRLAIVEATKSLYPTMRELARFSPTNGSLHSVFPRSERPLLEVVPDERERREAPRRTMEAALAFVDGLQFATGTADDLSAEGLFVATSEHCPIGTRLVISFLLPNAVAIETSAIVRWTRSIHDDASPLKTGMGLQFITPEDGTREAIVRWLEQ